MGIKICTITVFSCVFIAAAQSASQTHPMMLVALAMQTQPQRSQQHATDARYTFLPVRNRPQQKRWDWGEHSLS